jgi:hypothetical protein
MTEHELILEALQERIDHFRRLAEHVRVNWCSHHMSYSTTIPRHAGLSRDDYVAALEIEANTLAAALERMRREG